MGFGLIMEVIEEVVLPFIVMLARKILFGTHISPSTQDQKTRSSLPAPGYQRSNV